MIKCKKKSKYGLSGSRTPEDLCFLASSFLPNVGYAGGMFGRDGEKPKAGAGGWSGRMVEVVE